jgi:hypothetical protein
MSDAERELEAKFDAWEASLLRSLEQATDLATMDATLARHLGALEPSLERMERRLLDAGHGDLVTELLEPIRALLRKRSRELLWPH